MKRLRWLAIGAVLGVAGYVWAARRAKEAVPAAGRESLRQARDSARELGARVRESLDEGLAAMRQREDELRAELGVG